MISACSFPKGFFFQQVRRISIAKSIDEMRHLRKGFNSSVGFVPTMGALHQGHLALVQRALKENDNVVVSIFVNPTQFSPGEDLDKYPRTIESDLALLESIGAKHVFLPSQPQMYKANSLCHVEPRAFSNIFEGRKRPNFFSGVATIVCKLFNIVQPTTAYFGQKDISQFILLRSMVDDLNIPVNVIACETLRDPDGLAMSSRNVYLSKQERNVASILYKALTAAASVCESSPHGAPVSVLDMENKARELLSTEPLVSDIQYVSVASAEDMTELSTASPLIGAVISAAIKVGSVRLIDNVLVGAAKEKIYGESS
jgi:pantoate--beta-alanine ligase